MRPLSCTRFAPTGRAPAGIYAWETETFPSTDRTRTLNLAGLRERVRRSLRSVRGAFDLPSILVGVLVVAVMSLGVMAVVFGVIPFSQDRGAQQDLTAHRTAQGAARTQVGKFLDSAGLAGSGYIRQTSNTSFKTNAAGTCYVGVAKSNSGKLFFLTDKIDGPKELISSSSPGCISLPNLQTTVIEAGGILPVPDTSGATLLAWGVGNSGQHGTAQSTSTTAPTALQTLPGMTVSLITTGESQSCAVANAETYCWGGSNADGVIGDGSSSGQIFSPVKITALTGKRVTALSAGQYMTCAIADDEAWCWGTIAGVVNRSPVKVAALAGKTVTSIEAGVRHVCAVADGETYCWGAGSSGALGIGSTADSTVPVRVTALSGKAVTTLAAGREFTCASASDGTYCWGSNLYGQLGIGSQIDQLSPVLVPALSGKDVTSLTASHSSVCAVTGDSMYCWGNNGNGQLGVGDAVNRWVPTLVPSLTGKSNMSVYSGPVSRYACAVADSDVYCWGQNSNGQLGVGDVVERNTPTMIAGLSGRTARSLTTGAFSSFALLK